MNRILNFKPEAVIFDMDGLLVDTEPLWEQAQMTVIGKLGINVTVELCQPLKGVKVDEAILYWYKMKPWAGKTIEQVKDELISEVGRLMQNAKVLPGVYETINYYHNNGVKLAIASSSYMRLIQIVVDKMNIADKIDIIHSSEYEKQGKPAPNVFLTTAKQLGAKPEKCLVFEDSVNGVNAAINAGMRVVAVPHPDNFDNKKFELADNKVNTLTEWINLITKN